MKDYTWEQIKTMINVKQCADEAGCTVQNFYKIFSEPAKLTLSKHKPKLDAIINQTGVTREEVFNAILK